MNKAELQQPDLCVIGVDRAGLEIAFAAAGLGVPTVLVTQSEVGKPLHPAIAAVLVRLAALGVRTIKAAGSFINRRQLDAGGVLIRARRFVIATGTVPIRAPVAGIDTVPAWNGEKAAQLLVLGGGAQGVALAQRAWRGGASVALVADGPLLPGFDAEAAGIMKASLERDGIVILEQGDFSTLRVLKAESGSYTLERTGGRTIPFTHAAHDCGAQPLIDGLDLAKAGIASRDGRLTLSPSLRTTNRRIYAAGTVTLRPGSDRHASAQAGAILGEILFRKTVKLDSRLETRHVETSPAIAEVGEGEIKAKDAARFRIYRTPLAEFGGTQGQLQGHIKVIATPKGAIHGVSILAPNAAELIVPFTQAMASGQTLGTLAAVPIAAPGPAAAINALAKLWMKDQLLSPWTMRLMRILRLFG